MAISEYYQNKIDEFLKVVASHWAAYKKNSHIAYIALKRPDGILLLQAQVQLKISKSCDLLNTFENDSVRVGSFILADVYEDMRALISDLSEGVFRTPEGDLIFPTKESGYSADYYPLHHEAAKEGRRNAVFFMSGLDRRGLFDQQKIDWELKASPTPYEDLSELMGEFQVGRMHSDAINVKVYVESPIEVDENSFITEQKASISLIVGEGLEREGVCLGYKISKKHDVSKRSIIRGQDLVWDEKDGVQVGTATFEVPLGAVVYGVASYCGIAHHETYLIDEAVIQNPDGVVYNVFDNDFEILSDFLSKSGGKGRNARDFEAGISWLFWMLGFSPALLGNTGRTQDAPDLIVRSPNGGYLVLECTTGLLKAENKLASLVKRVSSLKNALESSGLGHLAILPVMVTSMSQDEISADLEQAEKLEVLVLTRERVNKLMEDVRDYPDADHLFGRYLGEVAQKASDRRGKRSPFGRDSWVD